MVQLCKGDLQPAVSDASAWPVATKLLFSAKKQPLTVTPPPYFALHYHRICIVDLPLIEFFAFLSEQSCVMSGGEKGWLV
jgi:hypothetical protein